MDSPIVSDPSDATAGPIAHVAGGSSSPVWESISHDVLCPLCDYNLRGLIDPRCPECGYQFDWGPLLNPINNTHRYLFEHHPEKNIRSFIRTAIGTLRPRKFWSELRADQAVRTGRLLVYWGVCNLFPLLVGIGWLIGNQMSLSAARARMMNPGLYFRQGSYFTTSYVTTTNYHTSYSSTISYSFRRHRPTFAVVDLTFGKYHLVGSFLSACVANIVFSALLFVALMGFRASMRQARIRPSHVLRCVAYSTDFVFWVGVLLGVALVVSLVFRLIVPPEGFDYAILENDFTAILVPALPFILALIAGYRLSVAYSCYLRFRHPVATVLSVQFILLLLALVVRTFVYIKQMGG